MLGSARYGSLRLDHVRLSTISSSLPGPGPALVQFTAFHDHHRFVCNNRGKRLASLWKKMRLWRVLGHIFCMCFTHKVSSESTATTGSASLPLPLPPLPLLSLLSLNLQTSRRPASVFSRNSVHACCSRSIVLTCLQTQRRCRRRVARPFGHAVQVCTRQPRPRVAEGH